MLKLYNYLLRAFQRHSSVAGLDASDRQENQSMRITLRRSVQALLIGFTLTILLLAGGLQAAGQSTDPPRPRNLRFEHFDANDGAYSIITDILQDRQGFIWFAAGPGGLRKYDGYTFTPWQTNPEDPEGGLIHIYTHVLCEDLNGYLWIGSDGGLNRFDPNTETFKHYVHDPDDPGSLSSGAVMALYADSSSGLWIGTGNGGLNHLDSRAESFTHYTHDPTNPNSLSNDQVGALHADPMGGLWIGTNGGGLNHFDPATGAFTHYRHDPTNPNSLSDNQVGALHADPTGGLWIGTNGGGLNHFDPATGAFTHYRHDPTNPHSLAYDRVGELFVDTSGRLWIGSTGRSLLHGLTESGLGLDYFDPTTQTFTHNKHNPTKPTSLSHDFVRSIYEDRQGVMWVGTHEGLNRFEPEGNPFTQYTHDPQQPTRSVSDSRFTSLYEDHAGVYWFGTQEDGLNRYDPTTGIVTIFRHDPDDLTTLSSDNVFGKIYEDRAGTLWVGTVDGLNRFDRATETFTRFGKGLVEAIYEDKEGIFWVGMESELHRVNRDPLSIEATYTNRPDDPTSLSPGEVRQIYEPPSMPGVLWIGTDSGLNRFDRASGTFTRYNVGGSVGPLDILERSREPGILWRAGGGLSRIETATGNVTRYTRQNSELPDNSIHGIGEDEQGRLWLLTDFGGLSRFTPETETFKNFGLDDGLLSQEHNSFYQNRRGEIFLGAMGGVSVFSPDQIKDNPYPPQVALTDFKLFNESVPIGGDSPLQQHISKVESLTLAHNQNDLTFDYVGLHYKSPERNRYAYRLEPYDAAWREAGTQRTATYTNLPSGDYDFQVKAANSDGVWNEEGASLRVTILPPWWGTAWAYALYGLLFIGGVFAVNRFQHRRLIARERDKARERELAQAREIEKAHVALQQSHEQLKSTQTQLVQQEKMASLGRLTAGIAHEIKNPLNFINNFAEVNEELAQELGEILDTGDQRRCGRCWKTCRPTRR